MRGTKRAGYQTAWSRILPADPTDAKKKAEATKRPRQARLALELTPRAYADRLVVPFDWMETEAGRRMAQEELPRSRAALMLHLI
jgi:hypothetical protein